jgi:hypothetical protein
LTRWCYQIIDALVELHKLRPPVIHRAVSCANIFIDPGDGLIKLGLPAIEMAIFGRPNPLAGPRRTASTGPLTRAATSGCSGAASSRCRPARARPPSSRRTTRAINDRQMPRAFGEIHDPLIADLIITCLAGKGPADGRAAPRGPALRRVRRRPAGTRASRRGPDMQALLAAQARERQELLDRHRPEKPG